ncbi:hypothetical protein QR680_010282 [Steinernema hermaphroditum]|uniref:Activating signal cointegrator 1 complex subunit 3 n=1 Tax=Steinernema hermaphroditum TaxID=289476 RepID=A0AA39INF7_9BILA|nr:hypothetical protein QR680_010282 [Steinernema hermaphroditum]
MAGRRIDSLLQLTEALQSDPFGLLEDAEEYIDDVPIVSAAPLKSPPPASTSVLNLDQLQAILSASFEFGDIMMAETLAVITRRCDSQQQQSDLVDLLGVHHFDLIADILEHKHRLIAELDDQRKQKKIENKIKLDSGPSYCQQVVVKTEALKSVQRETQRERKKANKAFAKLTNAFGDENQLAMELQHLQAMKQLEAEMNGDFSNATVSTQQRRMAQDLPYVFDSMRTSLGANIVCSGLKFCLPEGSERIDRNTYQEVVVPGKQNLDFENFEHVEVKDLDPIGQLGFKGFQRLNIIQSIVFEQAYNTRENLLICAPTGAGKTNIAMLAVLKTIRDHTSADGTIHKNRFKIVYIAPMKALATEMTESFGKRLKPLGLKVRELTGDTTLSKREIEETQMLVLTPEKWDVVTRKATADENSLSQLVRLLIIDEVHLLHDERGPVIETIVARTLRQVEMSQREIRIVGLSATLPNYIDCAQFLRVNLEKGLFFFDSRFRPIPLTQKFVGIKKTNYIDRKKNMDEVCNEKACDYVKRGKQVLIFVHSRNNTAASAMSLRDYAGAHAMHDIFANLEGRRSVAYMKANKAVNASQNGMIKTLFGYGIGIHHAGLLRQDRLLMERMFAEGMISVLCCTATLAWGVNLPAHAVIIKGTDVFDSDKGAFGDLGILDVQQIFGRAGRPQFETHGEGIIITDQATMPKYLGMLVNQTPIESQFMRKLHDNLNAEISLGTVTNISEAVEWLRYTYIYIRMRMNPQAYGIPYEQLKADPDLVEYISAMMCQAAARLDRNKMVRYIDSEGFLFSTDMGRIAAHFYITFETIEMLHDGEAKIKMAPRMTDDVVTALISSATEFKQIQCREEEMQELDELTCSSCCLPIRMGLATTTGKVMCLLQSHISHARIESFSLSSETTYIVQNATRLARAFFEIALRRNWAHATNAFLVMAKCIERRLWPYQTPLRQLNILNHSTIDKIENRRLRLHQLFDMSSKELGQMLRCDGDIVYNALRNLPVMEADATVRPITHTIMQVLVTMWPGFVWNDKVLGAGGGQSFWISVENVAENLIVHRERLFIQRKKIIAGDVQNFVFTIPVHDYQMKHQYQLRIASEYWVVDDTVIPLSMHNSIIPTSYSPHTDLLNLEPLSIKALKNPIYESLYNFKFLNPVQTQVFHCLYHSDHNALVGAPTGSGKTLCAELAMYRVFNGYNENNRKKVVYIAPLKALVRERVLDWKKKLGDNLGLKIVEVSGDRTPSMGELQEANVLITTPEKWDGITRSWDTRDYVHDVALVVIDEIHLLGVERGAVLEAIITRLKLIERRKAKQAGHTVSGRATGKVRIVGLSTALANAVDIADWLGVPEAGLFNFRPAVRPIPISVHIAGFPGQHYCPRMALMNKPAYKAIKTYSPRKPTLVFVSSRRQTRITATALVSQVVAESDPKQWLHMDPEEACCKLP